MKKSKLLPTLLIVITIVMSACSPMPDLTLGGYDGNTYANEYFGISFEVPDDCTVLSRPEVDNLIGYSTKHLIKEKDSSKLAQILEKERILYYSVITQHPLDYSDGYNPYIVVQSVNLAFLSQAQIETEKDYLELTQEQWSKSDQEVEFGNIEKTKLGKKNFIFCPHLMISVLRCTKICISQ